MLWAALLAGAGAVAFASDDAASPVVAVLVEALGRERAAQLKQPPELREAAQAVPPELRPQAKAALARLEKSDPRLLPEISRAYSFLGDHEAAIAASETLSRLRPGPESEVQHALTLARSGDARAAHAAALALDEKYPGRPDVAALLAATKGRGAAAPVSPAPTSPKTPAPDAGRVRSAEQALSSMELALAARRAGDRDAAWRHAQAAMNADPASPTVQEFYRTAEKDRERSLPRPPDIDLSANFPGEEAPRPSRRAPLWPALPIAGLGAAGYVVSRRRKTLEAHDEAEEAPPSSETERFVAGAIVAGFVGAGLYLGGVWVISSAPAIIRAVSSSGKQVLRAARSEAGALNSGSIKTAFEIHPRVISQLTDSRLGPLAGKLSPQDLQRLAANPNAQRIFDARHGTINIIQEVEGVLLRITVPKDAMKIISVGPIRANQVQNRLGNGDFIPIP